MQETGQDNCFSMMDAYLAILLETFRSFAFASHVVASLWRSSMRHNHFGTNTGFERVGILRTCVLDCLLPNGPSRGSVSTIRTVAAQAEAFGCKAFAVQLETLGLFTVAQTSFRWGRLFLILLAGWWRNGA